ncbi:MAG: glucosamine-6-phosphate deaminase [bacterium]|nr:glucosamine-6-phosphate deaminase [bacterium]
MEVIITNSHQASGHLVADLVCEALASRACPALGLATGSSPLPAYAELIRRHEQEGLSFANAAAFLLDEYLGLPGGHPQLYRSFIQEQFTNRVDLDEGNLFSPDPTASDIPTTCAQYEQQIQEVVGIDLLILGIGSDGHIAFNEPSSSLASRTRIKTLTQATRQDNARFFSDDLDAVPKHVITMGIGTILDARHLVMIVTGKAKANCLAQAVEGPITAMVPASALQLHPRVTVIADEAAASKLKLSDYYKQVYAGKPRLARHR